MKDMAILRGCLGYGGSAVSWIKIAQETLN